MIFHRNYFDRTGASVVEVFADRVIFANPGGLVTSISREDFGRVSRTRNPLIGDLMARAQIAEKIGTGIEKILNACKDRGIDAPTFDWNEYTFTVTFIRPPGITKPTGGKSGRKNDGINVGIKEGRESRREFILSSIIGGQKLTADSLARMLKVRSRTIERDLRDLRAQGRIRFVGSRKTGHYEVVKVKGRLRKKKSSTVEFIRRSGLIGVDLEIKRDRSPGRKPPDFS